MHRTGRLARVAGRRQSRERTETLDLEAETGLKPARGPSDSGLVSDQTRSVDEELQHLEIKIKQLKMEYEQYFMGSRPREPILTRGEVQKIVARFSNAPIQNTALRFRFNNLLARYHAFKRQWDAILKRIEDGTYERQVFRANLRDRERADARAAKEKTGGATAGGDLFDAYLAARKECGESTKGLDRARLDGVIAKQREAIQAKYGCQDVRFRVVVEDGKTKLKATPVR